MKTMKALVKSKPQEGLWLADVPVPEVGINDVLIRILKTSICGTDVHIWNWDEWSQKTISLVLLEEIVRLLDHAMTLTDFLRNKINAAIADKNPMVFPLGSSRSP